MSEQPLKKMVTRDDVARRAGVSSSTVSYVINNGPRPVSDEARKRVLAAIAELDYQPSEAARSLRRQRSKTIGLLISNSMDPFYAEVARSVEEICLSHGYSVIIGHSNSSFEREHQYTQVFRSNQVDGAILDLLSPDLQPMEPLEKAGIRTVLLERVVPGHYSFVGDDRLGTYLATRHLLDLGHRRIGYIQRWPDFTHSIERIEGYRTALAEFGLPVDEQLLTRCPFGYDAAAKACLHLLALPQRPTAIVAHDDVTAIGAMRALYDSGLHVPDDVSIVGFDDCPQAAYTVPPLTTVAYPKHQMGRAAAQLLFRLITGQETVPASTIVLPIALIERASTAAPKP